ncbi:helix-turn-helix domain-containing protein [Corynebacterium sp. H113]|uniref:helix-turn-helix domain-containing protein n=1 Tax=Corynebacterium sp. H113 TaxID=3133419 RepID=UPI00403FE27C
MPTFDPHNQEKLVSLQYAAEHFGVSERTLRRWISCRRVGAYKMGSTIRCRISEMERALEPIGKGA